MLLRRVFCLLILFWPLVGALSLSADPRQESRAPREDRPARHELRGVWIDRSSLVSREEIRKTMRTLAEARFNVAFVNVWSRGYPLWRSGVFARETGMLTDPGYGDRDVLREAVDEAQAAGIHVMPWVEYGFIGGYTEHYPGRNGCGPIFDRHPDPYGYVNFAQDYPAWMKSRAVDFMVPQLYRPDVASFERDLDEQMATVGSGERLVPGIDITHTNPDILVEMIELARRKRLPGVVIWYYRGLEAAGAFPRLAATVFAQPATLPW